MRGWSISIGKYFGVELRLHALFVLLLPVLMLVSSFMSDAAARAIGLWLLLLAAVLVRETGKGLASAAVGISVNHLILLPTGAAPGSDDSGAVPEKTERLLGLAGPLANFFVGITLALLMYTATPHINLFERPWFGPMHLLRSAIWAQVLLGGLNLLPAYPLDAGVVLRRQFRKIRGPEAGTRAAAGTSQVIATLLILLGAGMQNAWLVIMGAAILLTTRTETQVSLASSAAEAVTVADVMLTEFTTLQSSETLEDAANRSIQSLQHVFPVVRGTLIVGAISREALLAALRTGGNGYVQSAMSRTVETAQATDGLIPTLRRIQNSRGAQMLPVLQGEDVVGILTPANLSYAMGELGRTRRVLRSPGVGRDV